MSNADLFPYLRSIGCGAWLDSAEREATRSAEAEAEEPTTEPVDEHDVPDANGETYAEACRRMGYEPGPDCPAG